MKKLLMLAVITLAVMTFVGCQNTDMPSNEITGVQEENPDTLNSGFKGDNPQISGYPPYCFGLNVPLLAQVPPGNWSPNPPGSNNFTHNCGQTCCVMLSGYFNGTAVNSTAITAENTWLASYTGNQTYNQPNGWDTNTSQLNALLWQKHNLHSSVNVGTTLDQVINTVASGKPCIASVRISGGNLVPSGGYGHWVIVVGWNGNVIINDPGCGVVRRSYSVSAFNASWTAGGKYYMPVWKY